MKLQEKQVIVNHWQEVLAKAPAVVLIAYAGLKANEMATLRRTCRGNGVEIKVIKNTLVGRAASGSPNAFLADSLRGPIAVAYSLTDPIIVAKTLVKAAKDNNRINIIGGALEGRALDKAGVEMLSKMPGRQELRASLLGLFQNVPAGFLRVLTAVPGGLLNVLEARRKKMEEAA